MHHRTHSAGWRAETQAPPFCPGETVAGARGPENQATSSEEVRMILWPSPCAVPPKMIAGLRPLITQRRLGVCTRRQPVSVAAACRWRRDAYSNAWERRQCWTSRS